MNTSSLIESSIENSTIKVEGFVDSGNLIRTIDYNFFDFHDLRIELETSENEKKVYHINFYSVIQNNLNPIKLPIDLKDNQIVYYYNKDNIIKDDIPYFILNCHRKTKLLNHNVYTFYVEYTLNIPSNNVRKLSYKLFIKKHKDQLSVKLFESNIVLSKKKFIFNMAFIKRNDLYGDSNDDSIISFEFYEETSMLDENHTSFLGLSYLAFKDIKNLKLNEINSVNVYSGKDKSYTEGKLKLIIREITPKYLFDDIASGFQFKFALTFDVSNHFEDIELNGAYTKILNSLKKIIPHYNIEDYKTYGVGIKESESTYCELNIPKDNYYDLKEISKSYTDSKSKLKIFTASLMLASCLKEILKVVKLNKETEYSIFVIMLNGPIEDEQESKDLFVELSKYAISFIVVGLISKNSTYKSGFLSSLSKLLNYLKNTFN